MTYHVVISHHATLNKRPVEGSKSSAQVHKCWLQNRKPGRRSVNWIAEDEQQFEARVAAWQKLGVDDVPIFQKGSFVFMQ